MVAPTIISRADHPISRHQIDPDALKVLYRLRKFNHTAYLVGGGVRDLLLDRRPKDFDIGTSAHPHVLKRIFRNCWIIGRRFRLAHVKFGPKTIEVATFRRQVPLDEHAPTAATGPRHEPERAGAGGTGVGQRPIRRDNTFGTPEEDAFRRDFTINALFYDIATFAIIDYVGGMEDLRNELIRCIGNPNERFIEDPVRMLRAIALSARLGFRMDRPLREAIARHRAEIAHASPARMLEELYKILRSGVSATTLRELSKAGLLEHIAPELERHKSAALWSSLDALDSYRSRFATAPDTLTNPILLGGLVVPVLDLGPPQQRRIDAERQAPGVSIGQLPVARRGLERLRLILALQPSLHNPKLPPHVQRALISRSVFHEALTWLAIYGHDPVSLGRWRELVRTEAAEPRKGKRRRRRRTSSSEP